MKMSSPTKSGKRKRSTREELETLTKEELISRVLRAEAHNEQLKSSLKKQFTTAETPFVVGRGNRQFDFTKYNKRHVLLKFLYLGWNYHGLATQEDTNQTIEDYLFSALTKCCLVESRQLSNYHRCGRTDKGVSSFSQTISLDLRSVLPQEKIDLAVTEGELPYIKMLNRLLPDDIKMLSWRPVPSQFSARFNCKNRTYKYFFPRGSLDVAAMDEAAKHIIGSHDFRNLCKLDVKNGVVNYIREVSLASVKVKFPDSEGNAKYDLCELTLSGRGFLWHQVRCIMGVLLLVGQQRESPTIMTELLTIEKYPCKPQYSMASELPLNLFACEYEDENTVLEPEVWDMETLELVVQSLQKSWGKFVVRAAMIRSMLDVLEKEKNTQSNSQADWLQMGIQPHQYCPLLERPTCESLEDRIVHYSKKRHNEIEESCKTQE